MTFIIVLLVAPLLLVDLLLVCETMAGLRRNRTANGSPRQISATIIVPAHNEAAVLDRTLTLLKAAAASEFALLVVADNCSDNTAALARQAEVHLIERQDPERQGKGHALAFAREWLRSDPPAAVIVLDADCRTDQDSLRALLEACQRTDRPCQAINLLEPCRTATPMVQVSTFAFLLKNLVRQRGLQRLTGGVHLTGTGMCLPWRHFEQADLATSSIVEDVRLGIEMASSGARPQLVEEAIVWSASSDAEGTLTQRRRWEGGLLSIALNTAPKAVLQGLSKRDMAAIVSGLDLLVPPLAVLALLNAAALLISSLVAALGWSDWAPTISLAVAGSMVGVAILLVWAREGRAYLTPRALLNLPLYALWKMPMYLGLVRRGPPSEWLRSGRLPPADHEV